MTYNKAELQRFLPAQQAYYDIALAEIRRGRKKSHYIWFIFPQLLGLRNTRNCNYYGIRGSDEARAYLQHPILGARLIEITTALLRLPGNDPYAIFGSIDTDKLCACMTLFERVSDDPVFGEVLRKYFDGRRHKRTIAFLEAEEGGGAEREQH